jgi:hypothetical protein
MNNDKLTIPQAITAFAFLACLILAVGFLA